MNRYFQPAVAAYRLLLRHYRILSSRLVRPPLRHAAMQAVFSHIYQVNGWQNPESRSGPGSTVARTLVVRQALLELVRELGIKTLLDAPCGDFNWMKEVDLPLKHVAELIARNRQQYARPRREFRLLDVTCERLPRVDLIFCRACLVHFSSADVFQAIGNFKKSRSRYLLTTTFPAWQVNEDIATGGWRPLNLERPPFNFPAPLKAMSDGCVRPGDTDKALGLWRLDQIYGVTQGLDPLTSPAGRVAGGIP